MHVNSRIIEHLGSDLITSSAVAVIELIKNSLDAKSEKIKVQLFDNLSCIADKSEFLTRLNDDVISIFPKNIINEPMLVVEDIGLGMNEKNLDEGFLNIGTDIKKVNRTTNDVCLGEKGIGRLAAQRLGRVLIVETASTDEEHSNVVVIEWDKLSKTKELDSVELPYYQFKKMEKSYTRLWIFGVNRRDIIDEPEQISLFKEIEVVLNSELSAAVSFLVSPFSKTAHIPLIEFWNNNQKINYGFNDNFLNFAESVHEFSFEKKNDSLEIDLSLHLEPWFIEKTHKASVKPVSLFPMYKKTFQDYLDLYNKYKERYDISLKRTVSYNELVNKIKELRKKTLVKIKNQEALDKYLTDNIKKDLDKLIDILPIEGKAYSFKQDSSTGKMYIDFSKFMDNNHEKDLLMYELVDLKNFLSQFNGIKLYRNYYRIGSLGNKTDDWIEMQQFRTIGQPYYRFNQGNIVGYVSLNDPKQEKIREISSRLDMFQNDVATIFKEFIIIIFNYYFYDFNRSADAITRGILNEEGLLPSNIKDRVNKNIKANRELVEQNKKLLKEIRTTKELLSSKVKIDGKNVSISTSSYNKAIETLESTDSQIQIAQEHIDKTQGMLDEARVGLEAIEIEAYNNYKLMANGLITETITHELHSVINDEYSINMDMHFESLKDYLYETNMNMYGKHLLPIKDQSDLLLNQVKNISDLYNFLEKTFIKKNSYDEYATENIEDVVDSIRQKLFRELDKKNIIIRAKGLEQQWYMPKGVLLHVLYNLFSNSIYWVDIRKKRALTEDTFKDDRVNDEIVVEQPSPDNIIVYDTGTGVLRRMEYVLFDSLESGKEKDGRGMGLYIVQKLLNSFNADIELLEDRNKYGNRYIFSITVPEECVK